MKQGEVIENRGGTARRKKKKETHGVIKQKKKLLKDKSQQLTLQRIE